MALKNYTYGELLEEIKEEFGFDTSKDDYVGRRLNRAMMKIQRKRPTWHFLLRPYVFNVIEKAVGTGDFTKGSPTVTNCSWSTTQQTQLRHIVYPGNVSGEMNKGSMVVSRAGGTLTLDANYLGASEAGKSMTSAVGYYQLPDDFAKMQMVYDVKDPRRRYKHTNPFLFENLKLRETPVGGITPIYTVTTDPLPEHLAQAGGDRQAKQFLAIYPYITSATTLRGVYYFSFQNLATTADLSFLPQSARSILVSATSWLICTGLGDGRLHEYKEQTIMELEDLASDDSFTTDDEDMVAPGLFLESDGVDGGDGAGRMPSFNQSDYDDWWL